MREHQRVGFAVVLVDAGDAPERPEAERRVVALLAELGQSLPGLQALGIDPRSGFELSLRPGRILPAERRAGEQEADFVAVFAAGEDGPEVLLRCCAVALSERETREDEAGDGLRRLDLNSQVRHLLRSLGFSVHQQARSECRLLRSILRRRLGRGAERLELHVALEVHRKVVPPRRQALHLVRTEGGVERVEVHAQGALHHLGRAPSGAPVAEHLHDLGEAVLIGDVLHDARAGVVGRHHRQRAAGAGEGSVHQTQGRGAGRPGVRPRGSGPSRASTRGAR